MGRTSLKMFSSRNIALLSLLSGAALAANDVAPFGLKSFQISFTSSDGSLRNEKVTWKGQAPAGIRHPGRAALPGWYVGNNSHRVEFYGDCMRFFLHVCPAPGEVQSGVDPLPHKFTMDLQSIRTPGPGLDFTAAPEADAKSPSLT